MGMGAILAKLGNGDRSSPVLRGNFVLTKIMGLHSPEPPPNVPDLEVQTHGNIKEKLLETYHTYNLKGDEILKRTYWYKMNTYFDGKLVPQIEEGITKVSWVEKDQIAKKMRSSYGNISDVLNRIF